MKLPPIPKRKGMIAYAAQWDAEGKRWRHVQYRPAREAKREAEPDQSDLFNG